MSPPKAITGITDPSKARLVFWGGTEYQHAPADNVGYQPLDADLTAIAALTPASGSVITGNGSAWVAEQPDFKFLQSGALTGANVDIVLTSYIALGYTRFRVDYNGYEPATDGVVIFVRTSVNAGSSFAATGYNSVYSTTDGTVTGVALVTTGFAISHGIGNAGGERASGWCEIKCGATNADMTGQCSGFTSTGVVQATTFGGTVPAVNANAFRLLPSSGNFDAGTYFLRGIRDT